jgi:predicted membrane chloride channel (bestrophin family)
MSYPNKWPAVLLRRWLLSLAAGCGIFLVGLAAFLAMRDRTLLTLSVILAALTAWRCFAFYRMVSADNYDTAEGICVEVKRLPRKRQSVRLLTQEGAERVALVDRPLAVGRSYRLYLRRRAETEALWEYLETALGVEELDKSPVENG